MLCHGDILLFSSSNKNIITCQKKKNSFLRAIWKTRHRHLGIGTGIGIGIVKNLFLPNEYLKKKHNKNKHLCPIQIKILSFAYLSLLSKSTIFKFRIFFLEL